MTLAAHAHTRARPIADRVASLAGAGAGRRPDGHGDADHGVALRDGAGLDHRLGAVGRHRVGPGGGRGHRIGAGPRRGADHGIGPRHRIDPAARRARRPRRAGHVDPAAPGAAGWASSSGRSPSGSRSGPAPFFWYRAGHPATVEPAAQAAVEDGDGHADRGGDGDGDADRGGDGDRDRDDDDELPRRRWWSRRRRLARGPIPARVFGRAAARRTTRPRRPPPRRPPPADRRRACSTTGTGERLIEAERRVSRPAHLC